MTHQRRRVAAHNIRLKIKANNKAGTACAPHTKPQRTQQPDARKAREGTAGDQATQRHGAKAIRRSEEQINRNNKREQPGSRATA